MRISRRFASKAAGGVGTRQRERVESLARSTSSTGQSTRRSWSKARRRSGVHCASDEENGEGWAAVRVATVRVVAVRVAAVRVAAVRVAAVRVAAVRVVAVRVAAVRVAAVRVTAVLRARLCLRFDDKIELDG
jgi:hypothetical protein